MFALAGFFSLGFPVFSCFQNWCVCVHYIKTPLVLGAAMLKSGCYNLSADRIVAPYGLHAYMKPHDSDYSLVAAKLQRFGSFRRKALYKYGNYLLFINVAPGRSTPSRIKSLTRCTTSIV